MDLTPARRRPPAAALLDVRGRHPLAGVARHENDEVVGAENAGALGPGRLGAFGQRQLATVALVHLEGDRPEVALAQGDEPEAADGRALEVTEPGRRQLDGIIGAVDRAARAARCRRLRGNPRSSSRAALAASTATAQSGPCSTAALRS